MSEVYEYRHSSRRGVAVLTVLAVASLFAVTFIFDVADVMWLICGLGAAMVIWAVMPKPVSGMRVDDTHLTLSAWRSPRQIALTDIAYLRQTFGKRGSEITVMYHDGQAEPVFAGDLPDVPTLIKVMAERGISVRDES